MSKTKSCSSLIILPAGDRSEQPGPPEGSGGESGRRVGVGGQVQHGARQGGSLQHHESHFYEELQRVNTLHRTAPVLQLKGEEAGGFQTNSEVRGSIFSLRENLPCLTYKYQVQPPPNREGKLNPFIKTLNFLNPV